MPPWVIGCVEALRQLAHERLGLGDPEGVPQLVVGRVRLAVAQVARDRAREQERLLWNEADACPQVVSIELADVDPSIVSRPSDTS